MGQSPPAAVEPMLAVAGAPPARSGWAFEFKWDGMRAVVGIGGGRVQVTSRSMRDVTASFPELMGLITAVREPVLLDGELVVLDDEGRPDFGRLQDRMHVSAPSAALRNRRPVQFYAFDLLVLGDQALSGEPYLARRQALAGLRIDRKVLPVPPHYLDVDGADMLDVAAANGLEGIVAKRLASPYEPGRRSSAWRKTALRLTQEVVIGGWTPGEGRRSRTLGALLLGVHDQTDGRLRYVGNVGTGFSARALDDLQNLLADLGRETSPFDDLVPVMYARRARWVQPRLVGEVEHRQWTAGASGERRLRHPSWRGLRPDRHSRSVTGQFD